MGKKSKTTPLDEHSEQSMAAMRMSSAQMTSSDQEVDWAAQVSQDTASDKAAGFVGQWNRLVSTTNWEKGRIVCEWREALLAGGQPVTDYSDEVWSQLVGHVTSQHVGRLRRVFQRFGDVHQQYSGLYWSHFQTALDWSDAEMWLEGAIQNRWSVSQMRGRRWETLGTPADEQAEQTALDAAAEEEILDEDGVESVNQVKQPGTEPVSSRETHESFDTSLPAVQLAPDAGNPEAGNPGVNDVAAITADDTREQSSDAAIQVAVRQRLGVVCDDLPDDLAEAFEQFKLAIIAQRREQWRAISREGVLECLDALKELVIN